MRTGGSPEAFIALRLTSPETFLGGYKKEIAEETTLAEAPAYKEQQETEIGIAKDAR
jgi:hypothetical protein